MTCPVLTYSLTCTFSFERWACHVSSPVGVSDDHQIAEAARVVLGVAYPSVERGTDRLAHFQRDIHPVVVATAARTVLRQYVSDDGRSELAQILDDFQVDYGRQVGILDALVREDLRGVPVLGIDRQRVERTQGRSVEAPCVVAVQDHFRLRVVCRQRVERPLGQFFEMGSGRRSRRFASLGVDAGQAKKKTDRQYKVLSIRSGLERKQKYEIFFTFGLGVPFGKGVVWGQTHCLFFIVQPGTLSL